MHSLTTLAGCNGVSLAIGFTETPNACRRTLTGAAALFQAIGNTPFIKVYDLKMPQWGITRPEYKGGLKGIGWNLTPENWEYAKNFIKAKEDNIAYELGWPTYSKMTEGYSPKPNIYYFTYSGDTTMPIPGSRERKAIPGTFAPMGYFANWEGRYLNPAKGITDESWFPNDGLVNTTVAPHPPGEPFKDYDGDENIEPGIWIQFPVEQKHHMSYMGVGEPIFSYYTFFFEIMKRACSLPTIDA